ncbi:MAG: c-type cytochrome [Terracidiphilus sp.]
MKTSFAFPTVATVLLAAAALAVAQAQQALPSLQPMAGNLPEVENHHEHPAPTNLMVLPENLSGEQVHEIMEGWEAALGTHCSTCHAPDPKNIGPNGRPRLNYADDSKPEKTIARRMYGMTEDINKNYVSKIKNSGAPVTCGTCHRGHIAPEPFVAPAGDHDHDHDHDHSAAPLKPMRTPPPAESTPTARGR